MYSKLHYGLSTNPSLTKASWLSLQQQIDALPGGVKLAVLLSKVHIAQDSLDQFANAHPRSEFLRAWRSEEEQSEFDVAHSQHADRLVQAGQVVLHESASQALSQVALRNRHLLDSRTVDAVHNIDRALLLHTYALWSIKRDLAEVKLPDGDFLDAFEGGFVVRQPGTHSTYLVYVLPPDVETSEDVPPPEVVTSEEVDDSSANSDEPQPAEGRRLDAIDAILHECDNNLHPHGWKNCSRWVKTPPNWREDEGARSLLMGEGLYDFCKDEQEQVFEFPSMANLERDDTSKNLKKMKKDHPGLTVTRSFPRHCFFSVEVETPTVPWPTVPFFISGSGEIYFDCDSISGGCKNGEAGGCISMTMSLDIPGCEFCPSILTGSIKYCMSVSKGCCGDCPNGQPAPFKAVMDYYSFYYATPLPSSHYECPFDGGCPDPLLKHKRFVACNSQYSTGETTGTLMCCTGPTMPCTVDDDGHLSMTRRLEHEVKDEVKDEETWLDKARRERSGAFKRKKHVSGAARDAQRDHTDGRRMNHVPDGMTEEEWYEEADRMEAFAKKAQEDILKEKTFYCMNPTGPCCYYACTDGSCCPAGRCGPYRRKLLQSEDDQNCYTTSDGGTSCTSHPSAFLQGHELELQAVNTSLLAHVHGRELDHCYPLQCGYCTSCSYCYGRCARGTCCYDKRYQQEMLYPWCEEIDEPPSPSPPPPVWMSEGVGSCCTNPEAFCNCMANFPPPSPRPPGGVEGDVSRDEGRALAYSAWEAEKAKPQRWCSPFEGKRHSGDRRSFWRNGMKYYTDTTLGWAYNWRCCTGTDCWKPGGYRWWKEHVKVILELSAGWCDVACAYMNGELHFGKYHGEAEECNNEFNEGLKMNWQMEIYGEVKVCTMFICWALIPQTMLYPDYEFNPADYLPKPSGSVICTELYRQGRLPRHIFEADQAYGQSVDPVLHAGYVSWASRVVVAMRKWPRATQVVEIFAVPWAQHMAHREGVLHEDSALGRYLMNVGGPICYWVGKAQVSASQWLPAPLLQLASWLYGFLVYSALLLIYVGVWLFALGPQLLLASMLGMGQGQSSLVEAVGLVAVSLVAQTCLFATVVIPVAKWAARSAA